MVDSIDLSTNAYLKYPRPNPPPPRAQTQSYLNNFVDIKNPLLTTLALKSQLDQKEQSYYEILVNKLEFNNNEYVSNILSERTDIDRGHSVLPSSQTVCSSVEKIVTNSNLPGHVEISPSAIEPPIVPPPPLLSSFKLNNSHFNNIRSEIDETLAAALPPPVPEPPRRTHIHSLEPIFESLELEKHI